MADVVGVMSWILVVGVFVVIAGMLIYGGFRAFERVVKGHRGTD